MSVHKTQDLRVGRQYDRRQALQHCEVCFSPGQIPEGEFPVNKPVCQHLSIVEERREIFIADTQMVDPNRGIDECHFRAGRRRGMGFRSGALPPSKANRRAASRSTKPLSAVRMAAAFSVSPVKLRKVAINSSSTATVVRMAPSLSAPDLASFDAEFNAARGL